MRSVWLEIMGAGRLRAVVRMQARCMGRAAHRPDAPTPGSAALFRALAGVLLAARGGAALEAALLALAGGGGLACHGDGAGGGFAVGFGSDFFGHGDSVK